MPTLRVTFRNGVEKVWDVHENVPVEDLYEALSRAFGSELTTNTNPFAGFNITSAMGHEVADFGTVWLRMDEVLTWELDPIADWERTIGAWQPPDDNAPASG